MGQSKEDLQAASPASIQVSPNLNQLTCPINTKQLSYMKSISLLLQTKVSHSKPETFLPSPWKWWEAWEGTLSWGALIDFADGARAILEALLTANLIVVRFD